LDNLSKFNTDKEMIEELLKGEGPCLLDCMELILREVDVFSARKAPLGNHSLLDGYQYMFKRDVIFDDLCGMCMIDNVGRRSIERASDCQIGY
jgi:hypothetical protein